MLAAVAMAAEASRAVPFRMSVTRDKLSSLSLISAAVGPLGRPQRNHLNMKGCVCQEQNVRNQLSTRGYACKEHAVGIEGKGVMLIIPAKDRFPGNTNGMDLCVEHASTCGAKSGWEGQARKGWAKH